MTPGQLREALARLDWSMTNAADFLQVNGRTVDRWVAGTWDIPDSVAVMISLRLELGEDGFDDFTERHRRYFEEEAA